MYNFFNIGVISFLVAIIVVFGFIALYYRDKYNKEQDELLDLANTNNLFSKKSAVMRDDERKLFDILMNLYSDKYFIFPQVNLTTVLQVKEEVKDHDNLYREIANRSLDYVFFDRIGMSPILAIELNGESHWYTNRKNRDLEIEHILTNAGVKFLAIEKESNYDIGTLHDQIKNKLPEA
jgi:hypothetical protein